jgi:hypothetical protein
MLERVSGIEIPVFVADGDSDPMILPRYSHLLAGLLPDARLKIYADSAHGFLFQHHSQCRPSRGRPAKAPCDHTKWPEVKASKVASCVANTRLTVARPLASATAVGGARACRAPHASFHVLASEPSPALATSG